MNKLGFHCNSIDVLEEVIVGNGLNRGEFYNFPEDDLPELKRLIKHHKLDWSIHTPLIRIDWYPQPPTWSFLCDVDEDKAELTMKMVELTMDYADELGAEYIVVHFPSPSSDSSGTDKNKLTDIALGNFERLAELSYRRKVAVHIEGVGVSPMINIEFLRKILEDYPHFRYCMDIAHSSMAATGNGFDLYEFQEQIMPYLGSVHLWNTRGREDYITFRHIPVHPSQIPAEGWVDVERIIRALNCDGGSLPIIFESMPSYPRELGDFHYREGVKWVKELLKISS